MELVPILSTIILVATIVTFILAIGAYVLYKVRERRGERAVVQQPAKITAEVITPAEYQEEAPMQVQQPVFIEQPVAVGYQTMQRQPGYQQQQMQVPQPPAPPRPIQPVYNPQPRQYGQEQVEPQRQQMRAGQNISQEQRQDSKFLKYTSEGYVPAKEDKNLGALKWK